MNTIWTWAQMAAQVDLSQEVTTPTTAVNINAWNAIIQASPLVQLTLLILVVMSVLCWAITLTKSRQFKQITVDNEAFNKAFWNTQSLDSTFNRLAEFPHSNLAHIFRSGYLEMKAMAESPLAEENKEAGGSSSTSFLSGVDNLNRAIHKSIDTEISAMESRLSLLATTGSTGPFIGLFGTVWGIMGAFQKIGATNMASLAIVAPGISEALVATAIGLAAAIPATVAYNHYLTRVRQEELSLNNFAADFLNIARRNFFKEG